jgi:hypothetical protein
MVMSYYMLVGGLINELVVRALPLRHVAEAQLAGAAMNVAQSPLARAIQMTNGLVFLVVLVWFIVKVALSRRRATGKLAPSGA